MVKNIVITGAGGQIAYSLLFSMLQGEFIKTKFNLKLLEITSALPQLQGIKMELEDTASPYIKDIILTDDPKVAFDQGDYFFFLGAFPRGPGMERRDLLERNAHIFIAQGEALNLASEGAKVVVVGNPCNTNALILHKMMKKKKVLITSLSMLDALRAKSFCAKALHTEPETLENLIIWGNHSKSLYVDTHHMSFKKGRVYDELIKQGLEKTLQTHTQKRGEGVIAARGKSSAASAAYAALEAMKALNRPSFHFFSAGVHTKGNKYGLPEDLFFSMPCLIDGSGVLKVVDHLDISNYRAALEGSIQELMDERAIILDLLK